MHRAFTMIELIFVIIIIGVLAAVALPRFAGVSEDARVKQIESFIGTLNRTVGPILWTTTYETHGGSIKSIGEAELRSKFTDFPKGIDNIDLSACADADGAVGAKVADITTEALSNAEELYCKDGNKNHPPVFGFNAALSPKVQNN